MLFRKGNSPGLAVSFVCSAAGFGNTPGMLTKQKLISSWCLALPGHPGSVQVGESPSPSCLCPAGAQHPLALHSQCWFCITRTRGGFQTGPKSPIQQQKLFQMKEHSSAEGRSPPAPGLLPGWAIPSPVLLHNPSPSDLGVALSPLQTPATASPARGEHSQLCWGKGSRG